MRLSLLSVAPLVLSTVLFCAQDPAHASIVQGNFTANIASGTDSAGLFGAVGSLAGDALTGMFSYDTATLIQSGPPGSYDGPITVSETINGVSASFNSTSSADGQIYFDAQSFYLFSSSGVGNISTQLVAAPLTGNLIANPSSPALDFTATGFEVTGNSCGSIPGEASYCFDLISLSVGPPPSPSSIPEPAPLLVLGVGLVGFGVTVRRRRPRIIGPIGNSGKSRHPRLRYRIWRGEQRAAHGGVGDEGLVVTISA